MADVSTQDDHGGEPRKPHHVSKARDFLYKIVLLMNIAINTLSGLAASPSAADDCSQRVTNTSGYYVANVTGGSEAFYCTFMAIYGVIGVVFLAFVAVSCCRRLYKRKKRSKDLHCWHEVLLLAANLSLLIGGAFYLGGDNVQVLFGSFDGIVPYVYSIQVKDLRSYVVAFGLMFIVLERALSSFAAKITPEEMDSPTIPNTSAWHLLTTYNSLFNDALAMDAFYLTIIDEITHRDGYVGRGCACPKTHLFVAVVLFAFLSGFWMILTPTFACVSCCGEESKGRGRFMEGARWSKSSKCLACSNYGTLKESCMKILTYIWTPLMWGFLPIYLASDSKWPWVCFSNHSKKMAAWQPAKLFFSCLSTFIAAPIVFAVLYIQLVASVKRCFRWLKKRIGNCCRKPGRTANRDIGTESDTAYLLHHTGSANSLNDTDNDDVPT